MVIYSANENREYKLLSSELTYFVTLHEKSLVNYSANEIEKINCKVVNSLVLYLDIKSVGILFGQRKSRILIAK